jgi:transposase
MFGKNALTRYIYGIRSERRLEEEIKLNMAYRWFCGFDLMDSIPDHSVFSQNR